MLAKMSRGYFITFEGLDGSGKSSQLKKLAAWLTARGLAPVVTRQPGGTALGDRIRALLLDSRAESPTAMAELGLMFSDRAQCIARVIQPALEAGRVVLCDRYTDSTEAYQGGGRRIGSQAVLDLHRVLCSGLNPDLTFLLLPNLERSLERARRRNARTVEQSGTDENRFEREQEDFYRRVHAAYKAIALREPERVVAIESDAGIEEIHQQIATIAATRLAARNFAPAV